MKKLFKNWWKSKTQWFNGLLFFVGLIEANTGEFRSLVGDDNFGFFIISVAMVGWYLRRITTQSLDHK